MPQKEFFPVSTQAAGEGKYVQEKHCHLQAGKKKKQSPNPTRVSKDWELPLDSCAGGEGWQELHTSPYKCLQDPIQPKVESGIRGL